MKAIDGFIAVRTAAHHAGQGGHVGHARVLDHIGFDVKNLEAFCKKLEAAGIKLDRPYTKNPQIGVPVYDIRDAGGPATSMLVRNSALAKALATTLGDKPVALMRGHGNVVVGLDVQMAVRYAIYTEMNARLQTIAIGIGGPINYISAAEGAARETAPDDPARAWDLWKKKALGR